MSVADLHDDQASAIRRRPEAIFRAALGLILAVIAVVFGLPVWSANPSGPEPLGYNVTVDLGRRPAAAPVQPPPSIYRPLPSGGDDYNAILDIANCHTSPVLRIYVITFPLEDVTTFVGDAEPDFFYTHGVGRPRGFSMKLRATDLQYRTTWNAPAQQWVTQDSFLAARWTLREATGGPQVAITLPRPRQTGYGKCDIITPNQVSVIDWRHDLAASSYGKPFAARFTLGGNWEQVDPQVAFNGMTDQPVNAYCGPKPPEWLCGTRVQLTEIGASERLQIRLFVITGIGAAAFALTIEALFALGFVPLLAKLSPDRTGPEGQPEADRASASFIERANEDLDNVRRGQENLTEGNHITPAPDPEQLAADSYDKVAPTVPAKDLDTSSREQMSAHHKHPAAVAAAVGVAFPLLLRWGLKEFRRIRRQSR